MSGLAIDYRELFEYFNFTEVQIIKEIVSLVNNPKNRNDFDDKKWARFSARKFVDRYLGLCCTKTFYKYIKKLKDKGVIEIKSLRKKYCDHTSFFSINSETLNNLKHKKSINDNPSKSTPVTLVESDLEENITIVQETIHEHVGEPAPAPAIAEKPLNQSTESSISYPKSLESLINEISNNFKYNKLINDIPPISETLDEIDLEQNITTVQEFNYERISEPMPVLTENSINPPLKSINSCQESLDSLINDIAFEFQIKKDAMRFWGICKYMYHLKDYKCCFTEL